MIIFVLLDLYAVQLQRWPALPGILTFIFRKLLVFNRSLSNLADIFKLKSDADNSLYTMYVKRL